MSTTAYVTRLPACDICKHEDGVEREATYDAKTYLGPWANVCEDHFESHTSGQLGTGHGQQFIVGEEPEMDPSEKRSAIMAALEAGDMDAAEDLVGDDDIFEWL